MKDIQSQHDSRHITIRKVGIKDLHYPITVLGKDQQIQQTVACVTMTVQLAQQCRGTHMSRFVEILERFHSQISLNSCQTMLEAIKSRLASEVVHLDMAFPYFIAAADTANPLACQCRLVASLGQKLERVLELELPISVPNQNCLTPLNFQTSIQLTLTVDPSFWLEDLVALIEAGAAARASNTLEALCHSVGSTLATAKIFPWLQVTAKATKGGYQACATMTWPHEIDKTPVENRLVFCISTL